MTPLVQKMSKVCPDAETFMWFDLGSIPEHSYQSMDDDLFRLPFDKTAIVGRDVNNCEFAIVTIGNDGVAVGVSGKTFDGKKWDVIAPFAYINTDEGIRLTTHDKFKMPPREYCLSVMSVINHFLSGLQNTGTTAYRATAIESHINRARAKKGKSPLFVTWNTIVVAPSKPQGESKGGTHASPRKHDRRGHWRQYRNGKRGWVRQAVVGDASKGLALKDYRISKEVQV